MRANTSKEWGPGNASNVILSNIRSEGRGVFEQATQRRPSVNNGYMKLGNGPEKHPPSLEACGAVNGSKKTVAVGVPGYRKIA